MNQVQADTEANLAAIVNAAEEAADAGADLVLFAEAALTGLVNNDDPAHDLPLGQEIPGPITESLARLAQRIGVWIAVGLIEREGTRLYDSALLFSPDGRIALRHRRIQSLWHGRSADPAVYCQGTKMEAADTPLGRFVFLICGELFDDEVLGKARALQPDWVLFPFARCFDDGSNSQERWDRDERPDYVGRVRMLGVTTLMVNYLADRELDGGSFGGAMVVAGNGEVVSSFPLGKVGTLLLDL